MTFIRALYELFLESLIFIWDFMVGEEYGDYIRRGIVFGYSNILCALLYEPGSGWFVCFMALGCYWALNILHGWDRYLDAQLDSYRLKSMMIQRILFTYTSMNVPIKKKK